MSYEAWRISYQSSEQAARAAYADLRATSARLHEVAVSCENAEAERDALRAELDALKSQNEDAINTICRMFHSGEEFEGPDGLIMAVDLALWNDGCDALETIVGSEEDVALLNGDVALSNASSGEPRAARAIAKAIRARGDA